MRVFNGISFETGARTHKYFKPRGGKYSARKKRQMGAILVNLGKILDFKEYLFQWPFSTYIESLNQLESLLYIITSRQNFEEKYELHKYR